MHHANDILFALFVVFAAAQLGGELARRLKLPGVVGEILAGCVVGPSVLGWVAPAQIANGTPLDALSEIGVAFLLFGVGLETRLEDLRKVGLPALLVGVLGVFVPFALGSSWAHASGFGWTHALFVATAFVATSTGITARVLQELGALNRTEAKVILGAAVIDDILAMLLLGVVVSMQDGDSIDMAHLLVVLGGALAFIVVVGWGGTRVMRRHSDWLDKPGHAQSPLVVVLTLCLALAWLSTLFGLAAIIGAFLAGMIASETHQRETLEHQMQPLLTLLTPFFFVVTGAKIDLHQINDPTAWLLLGTATLVAVVSKLLGGFLGALSLGWRSAGVVGFGMVPRGEVGVVIASLGLGAGVFDTRLYAIIVAMSLLTTIITPPVLAWLLPRTGRPAPPLAR